MFVGYCWWSRLISCISPSYPYEITILRPKPRASSQFRLLRSHRRPWAERTRELDQRSSAPPGCGFPSMGVPKKNGWLIMDNHFIDDFRGSPVLGNLWIYIYIYVHYIYIYIIWFVYMLLWNLGYMIYIYIYDIYIYICIYIYNDP